MSQLQANITLELSTVVEMWQNGIYSQIVISRYHVDWISSNLAYMRSSSISWIHHITLLSTTIGSWVHKIVFNFVMGHLSLKVYVSKVRQNRNVDLGRMDWWVWCCGVNEDCVWMCPYEWTSLYISRVLHFYLFAILKDWMLSFAHVYIDLSSAHFKVLMWKLQPSKVIWVPVILCISKLKLSLCIQMSNEEAHYYEILIRWCIQW